jgi:hypothetical protein
MSEAVDDVGCDALIAGPFLLQEIFSGNIQI